MSLEKNDKIKWTDITKLKPNPKNTNIHSREQIERLAKIINYQGFRSPIVVSNLSGYIVAGHARLEAAKELGLTKVPVSYQDFTDMEQEFAHLNADNAIASWAEIDMSLVNDAVRNLDLSIDLDFLGFKNYNFEEQELKNNNSEIDTDDLTKDLDITCPKCGFEFESSK